MRYYNLYPNNHTYREQIKEKSSGNADGEEDCDDAEGILERSVCSEKDEDSNTCADEETREHRARGYYAAKVELCDRNR